MKSVWIMITIFFLFDVKVMANDLFRLQRLSGSIKLDGYSNEAAWKDIKPIPLTMFTPTFQGELSEETEIRIAHDDHFIYVSGKLYDSDPQGIQAYSLVRDLDRGGDFLNILLDTFNDNENLLAFVTTPAGNRLDAEIINDAEGNDFFNQDWNGFWDCAVVQSDEGWFAEMRIPLSSLRFQDNDGKVIFGLIVHRRIGRKNERQTFPSIPPNWTTAPWKASQARDVLLEGVYRRKPVYLSPYVLGGFSRRDRFDTDSGSFRPGDTSTREIGFDLKYGLTNNLSLDLTVNTDFAQVEADNEQVNLTRFSLFFPEKRQFFQERSGIFAFKTGEQSRLFHSRRIGLNDDGGSVRILGGARLVGRIGDWDVGLLDMQTARTDGVPAENFGVLRLRRRVFNNRSFVGGMATSRVGDNGGYNYVYALDGNFYLGDSDYLIAKAAQTLEDAEGGVSNKNFKAGSYLSLLYERRNEKGAGFYSEFQRSGQRFNPGIGFTLRNDFLLFSNGVSYGYFLDEHSIVRRHTVSLASDFYLRNSDRSVESALHSVAWNSEFKSGNILQVKFEWQYEDLTTDFVFDDNAWVPPGSFHFATLGGELVMFEGYSLRTNGSIRAGSFYDGHQLAFALSPTWIQSRHLEIGAEFELNRIRFPDRDQSFNSNILRFRVQAALNNKFSGNALLQHNSVDDNIGINARLRYNFSEGHDLYVVYNEVFRDVPAIPSASSALEGDSRAFLIKYIRTFIQ